jgi:outer membrane receptor protein involved in Fe transport
MAVPDYARRPFDRPTSFIARNLQIRDDFRLPEDLVIGLRFAYHNNDQRLGTVLSTNRQETFSYIGDVKKSFDWGASLTGTVFHSDSTFVTDNPTVTDSTLALSSQSEHIDNIHTTPFHNTGGSLVWSQDWKGLLRNITLGTDVNDVRGSDRAAIFDQTGTQQIRTDVGRGEELFVGAFVQASVTPLERLEILASGRLQYFEVLDSYDGNPGGAGNEPNQSTTRFNPRVSVRYSVRNEVALRGAYYEAFRAPTLDNLYRGFASDGGIYYPNAQLKPETLQGGEVGIDYVISGLRSQFTLYRTEINNLITTATLAPNQLPPGFFYGGRLINAASAQAQGFEAEVDWKVGAGFSTTLGYTFADSVYKSNPTDPLSVGQQLQDVPRNTASAALTYESQHRWRASTDARWVSRTAWANAEHTDPGFPYQASADAHFVVDLAGSYRVTDNAQLYMQIQNLLDRRYIVNPGPYNPPELGTPFEVFAGVRLSLN